MQNVNSYSNSFKNIEPSYSNEIYNLNSHKNNKIPRFKKYDKKNITLPFFYHIKLKVLTGARAMLGDANNFVLTNQYRCGIINIVKEMRL